MNHARDMGDHCPVEHCLAHSGEDSPALNTFNPPDPVDKATSFDDGDYLTYAEPKLLIKNPRELSSFLLQTQNIVLRL
ncbi:hypothetical protein IPG41_00325 [Candidatus Peregrinibacteria bacterium]|nr:MAG: hypothetical protein IPG41_00325 [Candidatus Peregrinibacteria bacterium]